jgi:uncharacterized membrane protein
LYKWVLNYIKKEMENALVLKFVIVQIHMEIIVRIFYATEFQGIKVMHALRTEFVQGQTVVIVIMDTLGKIANIQYVME